MLGVLRFKESGYMHKTWYNLIRLSTLKLTFLFDICSVNHNKLIK